MCCQFERQAEAVVTQLRLLYKLMHVTCIKIVTNSFDFTEFGH